MEAEKLLKEIKEELARKDETYRLIADSKPDANCQCRSCKARRQSKGWTRPGDSGLEAAWLGFCD